jgi:ABC-type sulfate transport system substrate-binding protein
MTTTLNASTSSGLVVTPDNSGNILLQYNGVAAPAFSVTQTSAGTSIPNNTWTKITFDTEIFDTNNNFASNRFTPTVAGYYQLNGQTTFGTVSTQNCSIAFYKNGSIFQTGSGGSTTSYAYLQISGLIYLNGSTDYVELFAYFSGAGSQTTAYPINTNFNGCLLRGA